VSKVAIEGNASGTGTLTIAAPNTNTNRTLTLPDASGTMVITGGAQTIEFAAGTAGAPSITTTGDTNTGIFFPAADSIAFAEGGAEAMRINSSGNVGIGTDSPNSRLMLQTPNGTACQLNLSQSDVTNYRLSIPASTDALTFVYGASTERARITSGGAFLVGTTTVPAGGVPLTSAGFGVNGGYISATIGGSRSLDCNRLSDDGPLIAFFQDSTEEGTISVSGSTVSYNGGHLSRWAQMLTKPDLLKGTVMSNLDEMNVYVKPTLYWTEEDELPVDEEGNPTVAVGDVRQETSVSDNEQLNKVKVSDVEGDANVAGVFVNWTYDEAHQVDEINMAMTGDMIIRIAQGVTVARGDLLMSAGDGTAKPQGDDIVRSKTIAKVTSTHITCTYDDGSYCVPCVLMAC
jgi:hypothetical protein